MYGHSYCLVALEVDMNSSLVVLLGNFPQFSESVGPLVLVSSFSGKDSSSGVSVGVCILDANLEQEI